MDRTLVTSNPVAGSCSEPPATLICEIYATALTYWNDPSSGLRKRLIWNIATEALQGDFQAPGIATLQAVLLDLTGRPVYALVNNVINVGRAVALAYSLGLNRNSTQWNIPDQDKALRTRLWWGVMICDTWYVQTQLFMSSRLTHAKGEPCSWCSSDHKPQALRYPPSIRRGLIVTIWRGTAPEKLCYLPCIVPADRSPCQASPFSL